jgi:hypothetical protein
MGFGFGPGFCAAFTFRPLAISASVHSQSVLPFGILIAVDGLNFPSSSQRLSVSVRLTHLFKEQCLC